MTSRDRNDIDSAFAYVVAGPVIVGVAAVLTAVRAIGQISIALVLVIGVVAAAMLGGKAAGYVAAVMASLSFNFFHTKPYLSLRIHDDRDVLITGLLLLVGGIVGQAAVATHRWRAQLDGNRIMLREMEDLAAMVADGATTDAVWANARALLTRTLPVADCRFEPAGTEGAILPRITREHAVPRRPVLTFHGDGFDLPVEGAQIDVNHRGTRVGRIVLVPALGCGVAVERRTFALAVSSIVGSCIGDGDGPSGGRVHPGTL